VTLPPLVNKVTTDFLAEVDHRLPDRLTGLFLHGSLCWGEFFPGSDIDFVAVWDQPPIGADLDLLQAAHETIHAQHPDVVFDGFHCTSSDLAASPAHIDHRPDFYQSAFSSEGRIDINLVTWHELAERAITVRGQLPPTHTDLPALLEFTRNNLDTFWRDAIKQIETSGIKPVGQHDPSIAMVTLGPARLHHLLTRHTLTSKSGAGRYVCDLDPKWNKIGREALRLREQPNTPSLYDDPTQRGQDAYDVLTWIVQNGTAPQ